MNNTKFKETILSFFVPFLGFVWAIKGKHRWINLLGFIVNLVVCFCICFLIWKYFLFSGKRFAVIGKKPLCNFKEERAIHFGSFVFILCYRCTFLIIGILSSFFFFYFKRIKANPFMFLFSLLFILPCLLDGLIQLLTNYTSTNFLRATTGLFAGVGIGYIAYYPFFKWNLFIERKS